MSIQNNNINKGMPVSAPIPTSTSAKSSETGTTKEIEKKAQNEGINKPLGSVTKGIQSTATSGGKALRNLVAVPKPLLQSLTSLLGGKRISGAIKGAKREFLPSQASKLEKCIKKGHIMGIRQTLTETSVKVLKSDNATIDEKKVKEFDKMLSSVKNTYEKGVKSMDNGLVRATYVSTAREVGTSIAHSDLLSIEGEKDISKYEKVFDERLLNIHKLTDNKFASLDITKSLEDTYLRLSYLQHFVSNHPDAKVKDLALNRQKEIFDAEIKPTIKKAIDEEVASSSDIKEAKDLIDSKSEKSGNENEGNIDLFYAVKLIVSKHIGIKEIAGMGTNELIKSYQMETYNEYLTKPKPKIDE